MGKYIIKFGTFIILCCAVLNVSSQCVNKSYKQNNINRKHIDADGMKIHKNAASENFINDKSISRPFIDSSALQRTENVNTQVITSQGKAETSNEGVELVEKRDRYSKTFANPDGSFSKMQSLIPFHYKVEDGWIEYSNKLTRSENNTIGLFSTDFPITIDVLSGKTTMILDTDNNYLSYGSNAVVRSVDKEGKMLYVEEQNMCDKNNLEGNNLK